MIYYFKEDELENFNKKKSKMSAIGILIFALSLGLFVSFTILRKPALMTASIAVINCILLFLFEVFYLPVKKRAALYKRVLKSTGSMDNGKFISAKREVKMVDCEEFIELTFERRESNGRIIDRIVKMHAGIADFGFNEGDEVNYLTVGSIIVAGERV